MASNVEVAIKAINKSEGEFRKLHRDLKKTQTEGRKAATVWDRFGKAGKGAADNTAKAMESAAGKAGILGQTVSALGPAGLAAAAGLGAVGTAFYKGTLSAAEWDKRLGRTEALLKSTAYAAGLTATELDNLARERDLATLGDRNEIMDAINIMQTFKSVSGETFRESITLAQDMATVTGQSLTSSTTMLGKALEDPIKGLNSMRRVGVSFTETEQEVIKAMSEANDVAGAQAKILEVLRGQFAGASEGEAQELLGKLDTLSYEWRDLLEAMEQTDAAISGVEGLTEVIRDLQYAVRDTIGEFSLEDQTKQLESAIANQRRFLETMRAEATEIPILDAWIGKSASLEAAQTKLDELESKLRRVKALQEGKDIRDTFVIKDKGMADAATRADNYALLDQIAVDKQADKDKEAAEKKAEKVAAALAKLRNQLELIGQEGRSLELAKLNQEFERQAELVGKSNKELTDWRDKSAAAINEKYDKKEAEAAAKEAEKAEERARAFREEIAEVGKTGKALALVRLDQWMEGIKLKTGEVTPELQELYDIQKDLIDQQFKFEDMGEFGGFAKGLDAYAKSAKDSFEDLGSVATSTMQGFEDAAISSFTGAKVSAKDMANSIIADIIRIQFRQNITGQVSGLLSSLFSGATGGATGTTTATKHHDGGWVGSGPVMMVPSDLFNGAQRRHSGGGIGPGERPIIAKDGEIILNEAQQANLAGKFGGNTFVFSPSIEMPSSSGDSGKDAAFVDTLVKSMKREMKVMFNEEMRNSKRAGGSLNKGVTV